LLIDLQRPYLSRGLRSFVNIIRIVDIKERLNKKKQLEDLREKVRARRKDLDKITAQLTH
jgi:phosphomevalonate kinase